MSILTPLARVRGAGSAHEGAHHWWAQRISAVALVPLILWFVWAMLSLTQGAFGENIHSGLIIWLASPVNALGTVLLTSALFYHAVQGLRVVVEDYVGCKAMQVTMIIGLKLIGILAAAMCLFAVMRLHFGL